MATNDDRIYTLSSNEFNWLLNCRQIENPISNTLTITSNDISFNVSNTVGFSNARVLINDLDVSGFKL